MAFTNKKGPIPIQPGNPYYAESKVPAMKGATNKTTIDAKYGKKNSNYRAGKKIEQPVRVPAIEESLYKEDDLG
tara:strand:- start:38 stop:259 length:222 start_codon:yes stop_codon:yes gene_type:complete